MGKNGDLLVVLAVFRSHACLLDLDVNENEFDNTTARPLYSFMNEFTRHKYVRFSN